MLLPTNRTLCLLFPLFLVVLSSFLGGVDASRRRKSGLKLDGDGIEVEESSEDEHAVVSKPVVAKDMLSAFIRLVEMESRGQRLQEQDSKFCKEMEGLIAAINSCEGGDLSAKLNTAERRAKKLIRKSKRTRKSRGNSSTDTTPTKRGGQRKEQKTTTSTEPINIDDYTPSTPKKMARATPKKNAAHLIALSGVFVAEEPNRTQVGYAQYTQTRPTESDHVYHDLTVSSPSSNNIVQGDDNIVGGDE